MKVEESDVPVLVKNIDRFCLDQFDLTTTQVGFTNTTLELTGWDYNYTV